MRNLVLVIVVSGSSIAVSQIQPPLTAYQQHGDADREKTVAPGSKQRLGEVTERLKRSVNGTAVVRNECQFQGHAVQVEESTEITEISDCQMTFKTRETSTSPGSRRELQFTIYANLAELPTPPSVEPQTFPQCQPTKGAVLKVISKAEPGKEIRATRRATSQVAGGNKNADEPEVEITRNDLSFFFSDPIVARPLQLGEILQQSGTVRLPDEQTNYVLFHLRDSRTELHSRLPARHPPRWPRNSC